MLTNAVCIFVSVFGCVHLKRILVYLNIIYYICFLQII